MKHIFLSILLLSSVMISCNKSDSDDAGGEDTGALHLSFTTPDWDAFINCDHLVLDATATSVVSATSESTKETFYLKVPQDSSLMNDASNIKKYGISGDELFTFNQTLPIVKGSNIRLAGITDFSDSSYNEVVSVNYDHSDAAAAYFKLKANYKMKMKPLYSTTNDTVKYVYGGYHFLIKTNRK